MLQCSSHFSWQCQAHTRTANLEMARSYIIFSICTRCGRESRGHDNLDNNEFPCLFHKMSISFFCALSPPPLGGSVNSDTTPSLVEPFARKAVPPHEFYLGITTLQCMLCLVLLQQLWRNMLKVPSLKQTELQAPSPPGRSSSKHRCTKLPDSARSARAITHSPFSKTSHFRDNPIAAYQVPNKTLINSTGSSKHLQALKQHTAIVHGWCCKHPPKI
jgi:hypothetical protein